MVFQQFIQSKLFHLLSMLICIGVVVWLLVRHYFRGDNESDKNSIQRLNTIYISGILVFIIIELVTAICMDNSRHADILSFVSFASTLSSLILSVVAIIFTIVSSNRGDAQYQKLDKVSDEVRTSLSRFSEKTSLMDQSIDKFQSLAGDLTNQIHEIYEKLSGLEKPIEEMREQVLTRESEVKLGGKQKNGIDPNKQRVADYISIGSFSGNLALYACVLSKQSSKDFSMTDISDNGDDQAYKFGYLISSSAMGIITIKASGDRRISVQAYYENLQDLLESSIRAFIDAADDSVKAIYNEQLERIKKLFGV